MKYRTNLLGLIAVITILIFLTGIIVPVVFAETKEMTNVSCETKEEEMKQSGEGENGNPEQEEPGVGDPNGDSNGDSGDEDPNEGSGENGSNGDPDEGETNGESENGDSEDNPVEEDTEKLNWEIEGYPNSRDKNIWFAEGAFYHGVRPVLYYEEDIYYDAENDSKKERQFLKVIFSVDEDEAEFEFAGPDRLIYGGVTVHGSSDISMLDVNFLDYINNMEEGSDGSENSEANEKQEFIDKYIFIRDDINKNEATLYIPVIPLMSNMKYSVRLDRGVVKAKHEGEDIDNHPLEWNFRTMAVPSVSEGDVIVQSVAENYDVTEPIIIFGKYFDSHVEVFFNNVRAHRIRVYEDEQKKHSTKQEDNIHYDEGNEDDKDNDDPDQYIEIYLPRGRNRLKPGLYNVTIENSRNHSVELYGVLSVIPRASGRVPTEEYKYGTKTPYGSVRGSSRMELIRLDHKEPIKEEILRRQLSQYILRSPIVETSEGSYYTYIYSLEIPYTNGIPNRLKVLRYDEFLKRWTEENCYINSIDQKAVVTTSNGGAFVVVEPRY